MASRGAYTHAYIPKLMTGVASYFLGRAVGGFELSVTVVRSDWCGSTLWPCFEKESHARINNPVLTSAHDYSYYYKPRFQAKMSLAVRECLENLTRARSDWSACFNVPLTPFLCCGAPHNPSFPGQCRGYEMAM